MVQATFDEEYTSDIQKKFLSLLVFDQNWAAINGLEIIKPEYFENYILHNLCKWMHAYHKKYKKMPTQSVLVQTSQDFCNNKSLAQKEFYLYKDVIDEIYKLERDDDFEFFKEQAVAFVRQAAWNKALEKGKSVLKAGNFEDALTAFKEVLSLGTENDLGLDWSELPNEEFIDLLNDSYDQNSMLKTGVPGWDRALGGGFVNKNVHIIGAPPGGGKSRIMAHLAKVALKDFKKVVFITLELSQEETLANINTAATGLGLHDILNPANLQIFNEKSMSFKNSFCADLVVKFFKPGSITADTIHNYIQKLIQSKEDKLGREWKPDVIFIDYMDKLLPTQKIKGNMYEDGGGIATDCKNLGITFNCPVITGSQLGRYTWALNGDAVVSMDSIADSAQKVHIAHSMTTINSNPSEKSLSKARLFLAKSRSGSPGTVVWCDNNLGRCLLLETDEWDPNSMQGATSYKVQNSQSKK